MTKRVLIVSVFAAVLLSGGCKDKNEADDNQTPVSTVLTPEQQKAYLTQSGKQIQAAFGTAELKEVAELADGLYSRYLAYTKEAVGGISAQTDEDCYKNLFAMPKRLAELSAGESVPTERDIFVFSPEGGVCNFEVDDAARTVRYWQSVNDTCTVTFRDGNGVACALYAWKEEELLFPEKTHILLKQGDTELFAYTLGFEKIKPELIRVALDVTVSNVTMRYISRIERMNATAVYELACGDTKLVTATADLPRYRLTDKSSYQQWDEWIGKFDNRYTNLLREAGYGITTLNLMNVVHGRAYVNDGLLLCSEFSNWLQCSDEARRTKEQAQQGALIFNKYVHEGIFFPVDLHTEQVELKLQATAHGTDNYAPEPVIYFSTEQTTCAVTDFFAYNHFLTIQQLIEELVNNYTDLDSK